MKKSTPNTSLDNLDISSKNKLDNINIKTTNINILLNRVRLDRKRAVKKKIIFSFILVSTVSSLALYFIV